MRRNRSAACSQPLLAVGDHDLNSFLLRLDPIDPKDEGLQPGMTVWMPGAP